MTCEIDSSGTGYATKERVRMRTRPYNVVAGP